MSAQQPLAVHQHARSRAAVVIETAMQRLAGSRQDDGTCRYCGRAWFGHVAYCPYCGRRAASARTNAGPGAPPTARDVGLASVRALAVARAGLPGLRWKAWWKPVAGVAAVLAVLATGVEKHPTTSSEFAGPRDARRAPALAPAAAAVSANPPPVENRVTATSTAQAPAPVLLPPDPDPKQQPQAPAPPAAHRSLCSAANEAAGLCNPQ